MGTTVMIIHLRSLKKLNDTEGTVQLRRREASGIPFIHTASSPIEK